MAKKKLKVGFDLDGVIVDKPFFMPKPVIEWLYRAHNGNHKKYRVPTCQPEILIRKLSHHWVFRLPLKKNLSLVKKIAQQPNIEAYIISGRFGFLNNRTKQWFKIHKINGLFQGIYINDQNDQPHLFKEKMIKKLKLDYYFDDDDLTYDYLQKEINSTKFCLVKGNNEENFNLPDLLSA